MRSLLITVILCSVTAVSSASTVNVDTVAMTGKVGSFDSVPIAYSSTGSGELALVFIHGGFADQSFWKEQIEALSERFQVVTLDLAGHGASGNRHGEWTMDAYGEDVRSVVTALGLDSVILVGNSLGGPVSLVAAKKLPGIVRGLVAVDTFQDIQREWPEEQREAFMQGLQDDFPAACRGMVKQLLLPDTASELYAWIEDKMCSFDPEVAPRVAEGIVVFDQRAEFVAAEVPIRAILGQVVPLNLEGNRQLRPGFAAVVMEGCGHYPQLERPEEFNQHLLAFVEEIDSQ